MACFSSRQQLQLQRRHDGLADLVLQGEDVGEVAVVALGPDVVAGRAVDQLGGDPHPAAGLAHAAFEHVADAQLARHLGARSTLLPLKVKAVLRATTESAETLERSVMMSSLIPSLKYSCSRIAAHVGERQDADRELAGGRGAARPPGTARRPIRSATLADDLAPAGRVEIAGPAGQVGALDAVERHGQPRRHRRSAGRACGRSRAVSASDCTHSDFTASADQMTTTALAACSRSSITSA